ncbi:putative periplasmic binding protein-like I [Rosa chinensis]|uniref:Putative periplasmic binding protein-like I n=1 Tax=Rosa chinensis TaxID=74649 RepID=A0A2P6PQM0_ROSCH|nr:putative periplasmic binding protein-like I [Rosa chinensis]
MTSPSLTSLRSSYFFRFTQNDSSQVKAISAIVKAFGWRQVVPIYIDTEFGEGIIPYLTDALDEVDVFIVHMTADLSSRLFAKAKELGMMSEGYVWLATTAIADVLQ